jgi:hypothetical protein
LQKREKVSRVTPSDQMWINILALIAFLLVFALFVARQARKTRHRSERRRRGQPSERTGG